MKRVRLNQSKASDPSICLIVETTKELRDAELGVISEEQKRYCAKCKKWVTEAEIESITCDRFGSWSHK